MAGARTSTLIIAPQLAELEHLEAHFGAVSVPNGIMSGGSYRFWGDNSLNSRAQISFFTALDQMLVNVCSGRRFPSLERVVILGHSGGGQFVNRYAASSPVESAGKPVRFIVMNPSSYLYFDDRRVIPDRQYDFERPSAATRAAYSACTAAAEFAKYDEFGYGLNNLDDYHSRNHVDALAMIARYRSREVIYLLGADDNSPTAAGLDLDCGAMLQGNHRLGRGLIYFNHLQLALGPDILRHQKLEVVPFADHNGEKMICSDVGVHYIFDRNVHRETTMPTSLADYTVIRDTKFTLTRGRTASGSAEGKVRWGFPTWCCGSSVKFEHDSLR